MVDVVDIRTRGQQEFDDFQVASPSGDLERRLVKTPVLDDIHGLPAFEHASDADLVPLRGKFREAVDHQFLLSSPHPYGRQLPSQAIGQTLVAIPNLVRESVDMVFRGQSTAKGKRPRWLMAASDVSLVGVAGGAESILTFEALTLGEAAPELFRQGEFPWTNRPNPDDTGFDLLGDVLRDVAQGNTESERFDARLLSELWGTRKIFKRAYSELMVISQRHGADDPTLLNTATLATAKQLHDTTPRPQAAMIVGKLDMIRDSTQTFGLIMDDGQEVRCMMAEEEVETLTPLFKHRVAVSGRAVFRASGRLLRVEAESVRDATPSDQIFAKIPKPNAPRPQGAGSQARRRCDHRQMAGR